MFLASDLISPNSSLGIPNMSRLHSLDTPQLERLQCLEKTKGVLTMYVPGM